MTIYPLATSSWDDEELQAMQEVIASGMFTMGKYVAAFEQRFADYAGSKYCVMVNSGSSANLLMVAALRYRKQGSLQPGDEVIVPAVSWSTTYSPLYQYGLRLKFVDIDKDTLNYDLDKLKLAVTEKTRALMVVNLLGNPNNFEKIQEIIAERNIILLEDNCESMGAEFKNKQAGTFGLMGSFSAFFSHHISTMEGGMVVTDDEELYHIMLSIRAHGWTRNLPKQNHVCGTKIENVFEESFRFVLPGYNLRPLELSGAIGLKQLTKLPKMITYRRVNAERFLELMRDFSWLRVQREIGQSSWFGFSMVLDENTNISREQLVETLTKNGIDCRPIVAGNFAKNEVLKWFDYEIPHGLENAEWIDKSGIFIGNHHFPLDRELNYLRSALQSLTA
ncbi:MAG TPA: DegT/DnrJ/EryC1/StrS family aminotransferase [Methylophilaceae bacterium]|nr:DegT/DnrJ/EryC1/StrS family aminotransferase [Methylophilaceae bacterium]